jgi:regulation of enolase protein 1 (concanavalin A-like superfamily)
MTTISIPGIPWPVEAAASEVWTVDEDRLIGMAPAKTDLFADPFGRSPRLEAPRLLGDVAGDFLLSARVAVEFAGTFDAGVLLLWQSEDSWAKLCFEYSPQGQGMVVSVVTRGLSDDCNSAVIAGSSVYVRVGRRGQGFAFHYSIDGKWWHMVRAFSLPEGPLRAGFSVQSPWGEGCRVVFDEIRFRAEALKELRNGE